MICSGCEDGLPDRCLDGQMHSPEKPWAIECDCASQEHDYKKLQRTLRYDLASINRNGPAIVEQLKKESAK